MRRAEHGYSLLELLAVVMILGIAATVAIPDISTTDSDKLDLAAEEIAQAVRFARSESLRTGEVHGVQISQDTQRVVAYRANLTTTPVSIGSVLYHPVSKQQLDFDVDTGSMTKGVTITNAQDPLRVLQDGTVQLRYGSDSRSVRVAQITGRVTVQ